MALFYSMHMQSKVERICDYAEHFPTKRPSAISPMLRHEITAVPFTMASRLGLVALFCLHTAASETGFACMRRVSQKAQCASSRAHAAGGTRASWETLIFLFRTFIQFQCQYQA